MRNIKSINEELAPLLSQLYNHSLYKKLNSINDIKIFMQQHVFAVWDFMSLLKSLQRELTSIQLPWLPSNNPKAGRLINEIVLGEETDVNEFGEAKSHFEMYIDAMHEIGADTTDIESFLFALRQGKSVNESIEISGLSDRVKQMLELTFEIIDTGKAHIIASAFTFGREGVIPEMFQQIIDKGRIGSENCEKLKYYLNRHIEIDGDEHGPLANQMVVELCGTDELKWSEALEAAKNSLRMRIKLWDAIVGSLDFEE